MAALTPASPGGVSETDLLDTSFNTIGTSHAERSLGREALLRLGAAPLLHHSLRDVKGEIASAAANAQLLLGEHEDHTDALRALLGVAERPVCVAIVGDRCDGVVNSLIGADVLRPGLLDAQSSYAAVCHALDTEAPSYCLLTGEDEWEDASFEDVSTLDAASLRGIQVKVPSIRGLPVEKLGGALELVACRGSAKQVADRDPDVVVVCSGPGGDAGPLLQQAVRAVGSERAFVAVPSGSAVDAEAARMMAEAEGVSSFQVFTVEPPAWGSAGGGEQGTPLGKACMDAAARVASSRAATLVRQLQPHRELVDFFSTLASGESQVQKALWWLVSVGMVGYPALGFSGAAELARWHRDANPDLDPDSVESFIHMQAAITFTSGFLTGIGGVFTFPVAVPTALAAATLVRFRTCLALASLGDHDAMSPNVIASVLACVFGGEPSHALHPKVADDELETGIATHGDAAPSSAGVSPAKPTPSASPAHSASASPIKDAPASPALAPGTPGSNGEGDGSPMIGGVMEFASPEVAQRRARESAVAMAHDVFAWAAGDGRPRPEALDAARRAFHVALPREVAANMSALVASKSGLNSLAYAAEVIPVVGGVVSGGADSLLTHAVGLRARDFYLGAGRGEDGEEGGSPVAQLGSLVKSARARADAAMAATGEAVGASYTHAAAAATGVVGAARTHVESGYAAAGGVVGAARTHVESGYAAAGGVVGAARTHVESGYAAAGGVVGAARTHVESSVAAAAGAVGAAAGGVAVAQQHLESSVEYGVAAASDAVAKTTGALGQNLGGLFKSIGSLGNVWAAEQDEDAAAKEEGGHEGEGEGKGGVGGGKEGYEAGCAMGAPGAVEAVREVDVGGPATPPKDA